MRTTSSLASLMGDRQYCTVGIAILFGEALAIIALATVATSAGPEQPLFFALSVAQLPGSYVMSQVSEWADWKSESAANALYYVGTFIIQLGVLESLAAWFFLRRKTSEDDEPGS